MTDVRLTAVNPEDSQVYPVACNDKGELLLDSGGASGDLDVAGNLTVTGEGRFAGKLFGGLHNPNHPGEASLNISGANNTKFIQFYDRVNTASSSFIYDNGLLSFDGSASFKGDIRFGEFSYAGFSVAGQLQAEHTGATTGNDYIARFWSNFGGRSEKAVLYTDGSASLVGNVQAGTYDAFNPVGTAVGCHVLAEGTVYANRTAGAGSVWNGKLNNDTTSQIRADGTAFFKDIATNRTDSATGSAFSAQFQGTEFVRIECGGAAQFNGNVTAPNINFKLAPATVAAMPAPLIDEGFAANNELDLLSVIIEMKLQIRDLNAFMQRSIQDDPET